MRGYAAALSALVLCSGCLGAQKDTALVLHYTFNEGAGTLVLDKSGHRNHGKVVGKPKWVRGEAFNALSFNGTNTYVECGNKPSLALTKAGTLDVWCFPEAIQGGLISWHTGAGWGDQRLVLAFMNYGLVYKDICVAIGDGAWGTSFKEGHSPNAWTHLVMTFDGSDIALYRDGVLVQRVQQEFPPVTKGVPVRIGLCDGLGDAYFKGMISEVRIYDRALSEGEIAAHFKAGAKAVGLSVTEGITLTPHLHAGKGELVIEADLHTIEGIPAGASARMALWNDEDKSWVADKTKKISEDSRSISVAFPSDNLVAGKHEIRLSVIGPDGIPAGIEAVERFVFPKRAQRLGAKPGTRILNNLVVELLDQDRLAPKPYQELKFFNPRRGWVFVSSTADLKGSARVTISVDGDKSEAVIVQHGKSPARMETLRFLPPGERRMRIWCEVGKGEATPFIKQLIVRSVPEMMQCGHPTRSLSGYGDYDFKFLEKDVLPNLTTLVGGVHTASKSELTYWKKRGRRWLLEQNIPSLVNRSVPVTADVAYSWWVNSFGFQNPMVDGVMADEFSQGDHPSYNGYIEAVKRLAGNRAFENKLLYAWCASRSIHSVEALSKRFVETVLASGYKMAHEAYLPEKRTALDAKRLIENKIGRQMRLWETAFPGVMEQMVLVLGYMSAPPETLNVHPNADFKVFLEMQFNYLANAPECFGIYGVMVYKARYSDEETVRWAGRLFRHYCIEGNTDLLSNRLGYKYALTHILDGDFDEGLKEWTVKEAQPGSVGAREMLGVGRMQGRVAAAVGNRFLWMKRCNNKPNKVSQKIKHLAPGKLYSMKMISADYGDWVEGKSERKKLVVSVSIDGADMVREKCFTIPNHGFARVGPFLKQGSGVPWHNYHWLVFRATGNSARLTLSDWSDDENRGGPVGRQLMFNFVEIQPYFGG